MLVEKRSLGSGYHGPFGRSEGRLGRWRRRGRDGGAEGQRRRSRHEAHGSGRVGFAGSRVVDHVRHRCGQKPPEWRTRKRRRWPGISRPSPNSRRSSSGCVPSCASEVFPLETLSLTYDQVRVAIRPLQEQVKAQGLWAAHLPPDLGGMGFGQVRLGLMHEILGQSPYGPGGLRQQRTRLGQRRAPGHRHRRLRATRSSVASGCSLSSTATSAAPSP